MSKRQYIPGDKLAATLAALPLIAADTALNAEHVAASDGWLSTLVIGAVGATLAAAAALPIAERALAKGYWLKAAGLFSFFMLMVAFSFTTSAGRVGSHADGEAAAARGHNGRIELAREAYRMALASQDAECKTGRGPRCRAAEDATRAALASLQAAPAAKAEQSGAKRLAAVTGLSVEAVALYQPLLFPMALQIGGFFFLAYGLAPRRQAVKVAKVATKKAAAPKKAKAKLAAVAKVTRKAAPALPAPPLMLPSGVAAFDGRAAMQAHR
jgi:hypothetical protein